MKLVDVLVTAVENDDPLKKLARLNVRDSAGFSAIKYAALKSHAKVVRRLITAGVDIGDAEAFAKPGSKTQKILAAAANVAR
jgi:hypothetical protein